MEQGAAWAIGILWVVFFWSMYFANRAIDKLQERMNTLEASVARLEKKLP